MNGLMNLLTQIVLRLGFCFFLYKKLFLDMTVIVSIMEQYIKS